MTGTCELAKRVEDQLQERNQICEDFFAREAPRLAVACREMSERFLRGGRLLAFGRGPYATDAQHVPVEFVHPVIVGKRALPALDLSLLFGPWLEAILCPDDMAMGFGPPAGDAEVWSALEAALERRAMTFALPGVEGGDSVEAPTAHPFIHQEVIEILYHTLWETVHVFFEHRELGLETGDAGFLYEPYGTPGCPYTREMREWLEWQGNHFVEYDAESDSAALDRMLAASGGQRTVPVLAEAGRAIEIGWQGRGCIVGKGSARW